MLLSGLWRRREAGAAMVVGCKHFASGVWDLESSSLRKEETQAGVERRVGVLRLATDTLSKYAYDYIHRTVAKIKSRDGFQDRV